MLCLCIPFRASRHCCVLGVVAVVMVRVGITMNQQAKDLRRLFER